MLKELIVSSMLSFTPSASADTVPTKQQFMIDEAFCLAKNVYFEARNQPLAGQLAVISVTVNRVNDSRFPNTICGVVYQGPHRPSWKGTGEMIPVRHRCQFSWYCDGKADKVRDGDAWRKAQEIAYRIVNESKFRGVTESSTHYHATYVSPKWAPQLDLVGRIGTHIFYRWP